MPLPYEMFLQGKYDPATGKVNAPAGTLTLSTLIFLV